MRFKPRKTAQCILISAILFAVIWTFGLIGTETSNEYKLKDLTTIISKTGRNCNEECQQLFVEIFEKKNYNVQSAMDQIDILRRERQQDEEIINRRAVFLSPVVEDDWIDPLAEYEKEEKIVLVQEQHTHQMDEHERFEPVWSEQLLGRMNVHVWDEWCGETVDDLRKNSHFPHFPHRHYTLDTLKIHTYQANFGLRIFGLLLPPVTGKYKFQLISSTSAEVWFSRDRHPQNSQEILTISSMIDTHGKVESEYLILQRGMKYFMEILHKHSKGIGVLEFKWIVPGTSQFYTVQWDSISQYIDEQEIFSQGLHNFPVIMDLPSHKLKQGMQIRKSLIMPKDYRDDFFKVPLLDTSELEDLLPTCSYNPSYIVRKNITRYEGIYHVHLTSVYPEDHTTLPLHQTIEISGNSVVDEQVVNRTVKLFMKAFQRKHAKKYKLNRIVNVEENEDRIYGSRFLLELEIKVEESGELRRIVQYVYVKKNDTENLYYPENFQWNPKATVHVIITARNVGKWVQHFINQMSEMYKETLDPYFNVIIVDYHSEDIDVEKALASSGLRRYTLIKRTGPFIKTEAINAAAATIEDPNDIVFTCDLHLEMPNNIVDMVRKHVVQGKLAFAPVLVRLSCGYAPDRPDGFWELLGYGLFGVCKSDWDRFKGMDTEFYKTKWGGEDWDLVDRALRVKLEIEHLRIPKLYHHHHSKKGMWSG